MRAQLQAELDSDPADTARRVTVVAGSIGDLDSAIAADFYDRPAARQDWPAALEAPDESAAARAQGRDMRYLNEIGAPARADDIDTLMALARESGLELVRWYGLAQLAHLILRRPH